jgi:hypothetical protein
MDPNRLTLKTQEALHDAQTKTLRYGHTEVGAPMSTPPRCGQRSNARWRAGRG